MPIPKYKTERDSILHVNGGVRMPDGTVKPQGGGIEDVYPELLFGPTGNMPQVVSKLGKVAAKFSDDIVRGAASVFKSEDNITENDYDRRISEMRRVSDSLRLDTKARQKAFNRNIPYDAAKIYEYKYGGNINIDNLK
jgi:hypothetical protein